MQKAAHTSYRSLNYEPRNPKPIPKIGGAGGIMLARLRTLPSFVVVRSLLVRLQPWVHLPAPGCGPPLCPYGGERLQGSGCKELETPKNSSPYSSQPAELRYMLHFPV